MPSRARLAIAALVGIAAATSAAARGPAAPYEAVGYASWYGEELLGNRTASGARFDPAKITAAHRTLPLNSVVEVTSLDSGKRILVLVNDRGPGRRDREIDLSRGAARLLGIERNPLAAVHVRAVPLATLDTSAIASGIREKLRRDDMTPAALLTLRQRLPERGARLTPASATRTLPVVSANGRYRVQVAFFSDRSRAMALARTLTGSAATVGGNWRVTTGPFTGLPRAKQARDDAADRGYGDARIVADD